jgi:hypothetical protein
MVNSRILELFACSNFILVWLYNNKNNHPAGDDSFLNNLDFICLNIIVGQGNPWCSGKEGWKESRKSKIESACEPK